MNVPPSGRPLDDDGFFFIGDDGYLKCSVDGEIIETDQGEWCKWNAAAQEWDEIDPPCDGGE